MVSGHVGSNYEEEKNWRSKILLDYPFKESHQLWCMACFFIWSLKKFVLSFSKYLFHLSSCTDFAWKRDFFGCANPSKQIRGAGSRLFHSDSQHSALYVLHRMFSDHSKGFENLDATRNKNLSGYHLINKLITFKSLSELRMRRTSPWYSKHKLFFYRILH